ncbi:Multiple RNA-binding domain-containing protein 1 [Apiospora kogelbergensis]|uniref:Multiple RNA-binding domain-containing protein 1 n=1 Tax=Apiospora kogelbergensis TaxID=1337665 RepID=UPI0031314D3B
MDISRVFVRGLPPTINEADFRKHFSRGQITDIKIIPNRRLGFVGYATPEEARLAVKLFNKSFIRMSKISVELAKPVDDPSLLKVKHNSYNTTHPTAVATRSAPELGNEKGSEANEKKRKRDVVDESNPKFQEYLNVMQHAKNSANLVHGMDVDGVNINTPSTTADQPKVGGGESDDEYEAVPERPAKRTSRQTDKAAGPVPSQPPTAKEMPLDTAPVPNTNDGSMTQMDVDEPSEAVATAAPATDDEWLRNRTNRLLDLVDDDDISPDTIAPARSEQQEQRRPQTEAAPPPHFPLPKMMKSHNPNQSPRQLVAKTRWKRYAYLEPFGDIEEVHIPTERSSANNKGLAFVSFAESDSAVKAFQATDGATFQGRLLHVLPASRKRDHNLDEFALSKLPLKTQAKIRKKAQASTSKFNWSTLYMSQDAVNTSVADRLGVSKSELLDPTSADAGVKQALAEASTINDTKAYFLSQGIDLNSFKSSQRGDTVILVKGFAYGTSPQELRDLFEQHGQVLKVLMPPTGTIAIVQFAQANEGKQAFAKLAYRRLKDSILFLEKGPKVLFTEQQQSEKAGGESNKEKLSASELLDRTENPEPETSTLFIKGLNFATRTPDLVECFGKLDGFRSANVKTKTDATRGVLSMGFGFIEMTTKEAAEAAMKAMDGYELQGHKLQVRLSHRGHDAAEEQRRADNAKKLANQHSKILIKNVPFQATKKDMRSLFSSYGQLRAVRLPKNMNSRSRGYAFVEFTSPSEAQNAVAALQDTHLLGRRLVIQFAEADEIDPEMEIERMQKKVEGQVNKVRLQQLTGQGRKKITLEGEDENGEV